MDFPTVNTAQVPSSELDAVNLMLGVIGAQAITALPSTEPDGIKAQQILYQVLMDVLSEEWYFNTAWNCTLTADGSGYLNVPSTAPFTSVLKVMVDPSQWSQYDVVMIGAKLFDRKNNTFVFPSGTTVTVALSYLMDFVDLPPAFRSYVTWRAAHIFADQAMGAPNVHQYVIDMEKMAKATAIRTDSDMGRYNMLYDNWSVYRVLDRYTVNAPMLADILTNE